jgi:ABC-type transporter Mla maintaining outer membrane lipid asymmetry ATPase subunit MlaF
MRSARRVGNRVLMLHEKKLYANAAPQEFFASQDLVIRQFVDGIADPVSTET